MVNVCILYISGMAAWSSGEGLFRNMNQNQTETNGRIEFLFSYLCHNVYHNLGLSKQQPIAFLMKTSAFVPSVDMREHVLFHKGVYELEIG